MPRTLPTPGRSSLGRSTPGRSTPGQQTQTRVLAALHGRTEPMGAYDILDALRRPGERIAPPTVYRALARLVAEGRVHRVESANAYLACQHDHAHEASESPVLAICDDCGTVREHTAPAAVESLSASLADGFEPTRHVIEVHGRCAPCRDASETSA